MKKIICLVLVVLSVCTLFAGCGKFDCDLCGKEKSGKKYKGEILDREVVYCKECHDDLEELSDALS